MNPHFAVMESLMSGYFGMDDKIIILHQAIIISQAVNNVSAIIRCNHASFLWNAKIRFYTL